MGLNSLTSMKESPPSLSQESEVETTWGQLCLAGAYAQLNLGIFYGVLLLFVKDYYLFFIRVCLLDFLCLGSGAVVDKQRERRYGGGHISCEQIELLYFLN